MLREWPETRGSVLLVCPWDVRYRAAISGDPCWFSVPNLRQNYKDCRGIFCLFCQQANHLKMWRGRSCIQIIGDVWTVVSLRCTHEQLLGFALKILIEWQRFVLFTTPPENPKTGHKGLCSIRKGFADVYCHELWCMYRNTGFCKKKWGGVSGKIKKGSNNNISSDEFGVGHSRWAGLLKTARRWGENWTTSPLGLAGDVKLAGEVFSGGTLRKEKAKDGASCKEEGNATLRWPESYDENSKGLFS